MHIALHQDGFVKYDEKFPGQRTLVHRFVLAKSFHFYTTIYFLIIQDGFVKYDEEFPGQRTLADIDHCRVVLR